MLKDILCKNCNRLLCKAKVFVGEIKCGRCNHVAEYRLLTDSFIKAVQEGDVYEHEHTPNHKTIALV